MHRFIFTKAIVFDTKPLNIKLRGFSWVFKYINLYYNQCIINIKNNEFLYADRRVYLHWEKISLINIHKTIKRDGIQMAKIDTLKEYSCKRIFSEKVNGGWLNGKYNLYRDWTFLLISSIIMFIILIINGFNFYLYLMPLAIALTAIITLMVSIKDKNRKYN